jgi:hypothetical protein
MPGAREGGMTPDEMNELECAQGTVEALRIIGDGLMDTGSDSYSGTVAEAVFAAGKKIAGAITPADAMAGTDAVGGRVASLTEAVMGLTSAMVRIADAIESVATALEGKS